MQVHSKIIAGGGLGASASPEMHRDGPEERPEPHDLIALGDR